MTLGLILIWDHEKHRRDLHHRARRDLNGERGYEKQLHQEYRPGRDVHPCETLQFEKHLGRELLEPPAPVPEASHRQENNPYPLRRTVPFPWVDPHDPLAHGRPASSKGAMVR